jgi:hypothetical protein
MDVMTGHLIESSIGGTVLEDAVPVNGSEVTTTPVPGELGELLTAELARLAAEQVRAGGLKLMGEGGLLPRLTKQLMEAALEAEMDQHLAAEAMRAGGKGATRAATPATATGPRRS